MSSSMKFSLLALVGAAAAVPHYNAHSKFHHTPSGGYAGPTGGWNGQNSTIVGPTGSGVAPGPGDESTTQTTTTHISKATLTQTIYVTPVPASGVPTSVAAVDVGQSTGPSVCGPATVTVTATNKVTVTVPAGGAESSAYVPAPEAPTSVDDATVPSYAPVEPHKPSSSVVKEAETTKAVPSKEAPSKEAPVEDVPSSTEEGTTYVAPTKEVPTDAPSSTKIATSSTEAAVPSKHTSATPSSKPTSSPSTGGKRGLLYKEDRAVDAKGVASLGNFGWASNWEADVRGDIGNLEFIPTLRSLDRAGEWSAKIDTAVAAGSKVVFTFNEPDISGQANLSPLDACKAWKNHVADLISKHPGVTFVAPSISSTSTVDKPNMGLGWLTQFQSICPEALSVANYHWYGPATVGFAGFKAYIEEAHAKIGKDFYVTEFGVNQGASAEDSAAFLKEAQAYLDSHPNCLGYAYFAVGSFQLDDGMGMTPENLLGTSEALTPAGKVYVS